MVHTKTIACVQKAESLLSDASEDSLRYATLQLRMGIEYLFYELIPLYKEELPEDITNKIWQPQKIIDALLECDPDVAKDGRITIGTYAPDGGLMPPNIVKDIKAPNKRMLKDHYHRLGFHLHAPVNLKSPDIVKWQSDLQKAIECLRHFQDNQALSNVRQLFEIPCECGRTIKRNRRGVEATGEMKCPNPECRAIFDVTFENSKTQYALRQTPYRCPSCGTENLVPVHRVVDTAPITCPKCACRGVIRLRFVVERLDGHSASENAV